MPLETIESVSGSHTLREKVFLLWLLITTISGLGLMAVGVTSNTYLIWRAESRIDSLERTDYETREELRKVNARVDLNYGRIDQLNARVDKLETNK